MDAYATVPDAIRKTCEAYVEGLSTVMRALESLPKEAGATHRRMVEQWLSLGRTSKESFVAALNQGFDVWERECRRAVGAPHPTGTLGAGANPLEAWADNWRRTVEAFTSGAMASSYSDAIRRQSEMVQRSIEEGMKTWQRVWQPGERK